MAETILTDIFGRGFVDENLARSQDFRESQISPRLRDGYWTLTEDEVRGWVDAFAARRRPGRTAAAVQKESPANPISSPPPRPPEPTQAPAPPEINVVVNWGALDTTKARIRYLTSTIALLDGHKPGGTTYPVGTLLRIHFPDERGLRMGRLAAYGQGSVYLVTLGSRAIRRSARVPVDLPASIRTTLLDGTAMVRVADLSSGGARVQGLALPVGADLDVTFSPPGRSDQVTLRAVVVRSSGSGTDGEIGVAFCMATLHFTVPVAQPQPVAAQAAR